MPQNKQNCSNNSRPIINSIGLLIMHSEIIQRRTVLTPRWFGVLRSVQARICWLVLRSFSSIVMTATFLPQFSVSLRRTGPRFELEENGRIRRIARLCRTACLWHLPRLGVILSDQIETRCFSQQFTGFAYRFPLKYGRSLLSFDNKFG